MNVLSWNVRGLNSRDKQLDVKNFLKSEKADLICLIDSKIQPNHQDRTCRFICPDFSYAFSPEGRIGLLWNPSCFAIQVIEANLQFIHFRATPLVCSITSFLVTAVYASNSPSDRILLWNHLIRISDHLEPWLICGDFNEVIFNHEKVGGRPINSRRVRKFNECLEACSL
ncbi:hypothetical protein QJS04_geneDACA014815 [Acorus gramineus]|uniref:Endonuclease/exonuclease/phosphatase domain-containing protein n=1 Tax=Acorus gramineus TaxID=55184 RepID=A0AAV9BPH9_ACOGR|nr:hypothetical protein QJS04_geneDACA014815 [Acorus gramineus]